jgi:hypothetical protein
MWLIACIEYSTSIAAPWRTFESIEAAPRTWLRYKERFIGNPHHIETCVRYASMRQIHAAIEHLHRGDFECAITLAAAGQGMLPPTDEPHFRKLEAAAGVDDIVAWLAHGQVKDQMSATWVRREIVTIEESQVISFIYRAVAKFDTIFGDQKTPQMISFRIFAMRRMGMQ